MIQEATTANAWWHVREGYWLEADSQGYCAMPVTD